jgi:predicted NBD/HSP70 family sugar kinase
LQGNNSTILKKANRYLIIASIRRFGQITIENLMSITGLSRPTVRNILDELLADNLVEAIGYAKTEIGRQPTLYQLNMKLNYAIGVDIEIAPVRLMFADLGGNVVFHKTWNENVDGTEDELGDRIIKAVNEGMNELSISSDNVVGIGMGIPGLIDMHQNIITHIPRFPNIHGSCLAKRIEEELDIQVYLCNDVKLIAMADPQIMDSEYDNVLYIAYRVGIGMAILHKNEVYDGEYGNSGYLGHTTINPVGETCLCGNRGCLELYCSRQVLMETYNRRQGEKPVDSFETLLDLADLGNQGAREVLDEGGQYLGIAIANAMKLFDISVVVLGDLCENEDGYYFKTIQRVVKECMTHTEGEIIFKLGSNAEGSFAIGGCKFVLGKYFKEPKLRLSYAV